MDIENYYSPSHPNKIHQVVVLVGWLGQLFSIVKIIFFMLIFFAAYCGAEGGDPAEDGEVDEEQGAGSVRLLQLHAHAEHNEELVRSDS